jgi:DNA mismatch repair protein MutH
MIPYPPTDAAQLLARANALTHLSLGELAQQLQIPLPKDTRSGKGWIGQLLEMALGANSGNKAQPDFAHLGIELKTIPVNPKLRPLESTFICSASLMPTAFQTFETSIVYQKLQKVLWMPIITESRTQTLSNRSMGQPILWQPNDEQIEQLRLDWEELTQMISMGELAQITAKQGTYLQLRPKGAHAKVLCKAIGEYGEPILTLPRGFYLRAGFTESILRYNLSTINQG